MPGVCTPVLNRLLSSSSCKRIRNVPLAEKSDRSVFSLMYACGESLEALLNIKMPGIFHIRCFRFIRYPCGDDFFDAHGYVQTKL